MGLIKAAVGAISSTLQDQWKEAIRCEDLGNDILMRKVTTPNRVISNGSTIIVGPGQCAIIYDNGRIVDASAEEGVYTFDTSSTPSLFAGQFGETFKEMWQRFTYNGATAKEQAVYFFNLKEITDNGFGTSTPVPYKDWGHPIMNARTNSYIGMSVKIKCYGKYTFKICDPFTFMSTFAGTADVYRKDNLVEQIRTEVVSSFINVLNALCTDKYKVEALEIPSKTLEIKKLMDENEFDKDIKNRGITLVTFNVEGVSLDDESNKKIDQYELGGDAYQQQGAIVESYAEAIPEAAKNSNGAMNGFMGIGMMNMTSGGMFTEEMSKSAHQKKDKEESARANRDTERRIRLSDTIPNLDFRPLKRENKEEINFIYNIKKEKYKEENKKELDKEILNKLLERYIKENAKNIKVIMLKEEKIGFFDGKILENNTFRIDNIFILKEYQNKGIETAISNEILFENEKVDKSK